MWVGSTLLTRVQFTAANLALHASPRGTYNDTNALANVTVLGVQHEVTHVTLNGEEIPREGVEYNATSKALFVTVLRELTSQGAWARKWVMEWS